MATWYVYSGATGTASGADWTNAKTTLGAAATASAAGDTVFVANDHSETTAGTYSVSFKTGAMTKVVCVNRSGSFPPTLADKTTGAVINQTTSGNDCVVSGNVYVYGLQLNAGSGSTQFVYLRMGSLYQVWERCVFKLAHTVSSSAIWPAYTAGNGCEWINCQVEFGSTAQGLQQGVWFKWTNDPSVPAFTSTSTIYPTTFINTASNPTGLWRLSGLDLTAMPTGRNLCMYVLADTIFNNCKFPASTALTFANSPVSAGRGPFQMINCTMGGVSRSQRDDEGGQSISEYTVVRTNGATDGNAAYSWKNVVSAAATTGQVHTTWDGAVWNTSTGVAKTLTVHLLTNNVTLTDQDVWLDVEYNGTAGSPLSTHVSSRSDIALSTAASLASDTAAWTTTGISTPVKQKLQVTFTPQAAGPVRWRVRFVKPSLTCYVCPYAELV